MPKSLVDSASSPGSIKNPGCWEKKLALSLLPFPSVSSVSFGGVGESSVELIDHLLAVLEVSSGLPGIFLRSKSFPADKILVFLPARPTVQNFFYFPFFMSINGDGVGCVGLTAFNQIRLTSSKQ